MMPTATGFIAPEIEWIYLTPLLIVFGTGVVGVLVEAFVPARVRRTVHVVLTGWALVAALASVVLIWTKPEVDAPREFAVGGLPLPLEIARGVDVVGPAYVADPFAIAAQALLLVLAFLALFLMAAKVSGQDAFAPTAAAVPGSPYEELARRRGLEQTEVFPLMLFAVGGMMVFVSTQNLLVMFVALEVLSLPLYVLTAMARRRRVMAQEASLKYFLLGAFASALFLFGTALIYGFSGSVQLGTIFGGLFNASVSEVLAAEVSGLPASEISKEIAVQMADAAAISTSFYPLILVGLLLIVVGLLFKVGAAPFHSWTPDVYQGAPTPVTAFMAACTKVAAVAALVRVLYVVAIPLTVPLREHLWVGLWIVTILTMVVGTVIAVVQTDLKRMLAYSSIAHAGFILVGIAGCAPGPFIEDIAANAAQNQGQVETELLATVAARASESVSVSASAILVYLLAYGTATIGAFAVVSLVRQQARRAIAVQVPVTGAQDGTSPAPGAETVLGEASHLSQWAGLGRRSPWLAGAFALFLLSMAGIPLTGGFIAKFGVFRAAIEGEATVLAVIGVCASAVAVFFYARIIVVMFFTEPADDGERPPVVAATSASAAVVIAVCAVAVVLLGVFPSWVLELADQAAKFAL